MTTREISPQPTEQLPVHLADATADDCVAIAAEEDPCVAITFAEVAATSDVPAGVINISTGRTSELAPHLAAHADVNALDVTGSDPELRASLEQAAAETVKRVYVPRVRLISQPLLAQRDSVPSWRSRRCGIQWVPSRCPAVPLT